MFSTTLVSSFLNYYRTPLENATMQLRLKRFYPILKLEIPIHIFVGPECHFCLVQFLNRSFKNEENWQKWIYLTKLDTNFFQSSWIYKIAIKCETTQLPSELCEPKDTFDYMCYLHSKIEYLNEAVEMNVFSTAYFAWIDHNLSQMFNEGNTIPYRNIEDWCTRMLWTPKCLPATEHECAKSLIPVNEIYIPGCLRHTLSQNDFTEKVLWRFCGGFLLGTEESIQNLWTLYKIHFETFLRDTSTMVWDVNFWAWLESNTEWSPIWYEADHNETIVNIPMYVRSSRAMDIVSNVHNIVLPDIKNGDYHASALSIVSNPANTSVNVRYVNYNYLPSGHCTINHPNGFTCTVNRGCIFPTSNVMSQLHNLEDVVEDELIENETIEIFQGMEDIRLFYWDGVLRFLGTSVNFSGIPGKSRVLMGDYIYETNNPVLKNVSVIQPPTNTVREKNWIPIVLEGERLRILYSWSPYTVCEISNNTLKVITEKTIQNPIFQLQNVRGSTNFVSYDAEYLVGLVHFSIEHTLPKQYYHMLVQLDANTLIPKRFSDPFYFDTVGIEFCICMEVEIADVEDLEKENEYIFWVSRQDRDIKKLCVPFSQIDFPHSFRYL